MRRLTFKLRRILGQSVTFDDVLAMYHEGAVKDAYAALLEVTENAPELLEDGGIYTLWAELEFMVNNNTSRALELLEKAHELGGVDMVYYHNVRGDVLLRIGDYEKALQSYEQSVAIDSNMANLEAFGRALSQANDSRAAGVWRQILDKDPSNAAAHVYIGLAAAKSGDRDKAMLMARRALKLNPWVEDVYMIGFLYYLLGEFELALNECLTAEKLGHKDKPLVYSTTAACHFSLGHSGKGRKYVQMALRLNPDYDYAKEVLREYEEIQAEEN